MTYTFDLEKTGDGYYSLTVNGTITTSCLYKVAVDRWDALYFPPGTDQGALSGSFENHRQAFRWLTGKVQGVGR